MAGKTGFQHLKVKGSVHIADIEAGRRKGALETARKLAEAPGVAIDDLV